MKMYNVTYVERLSYQDTVYADTEEEAKRQLIADIERGSTVNYDGIVEEFEAEEVSYATQKDY